MTIHSRPAPPFTLGGAHDGGETFLAACARRGLPETFTAVDPTQGRAMDLARRFSRPGTHALGIEARLEDVLTRPDLDGPLILAMDHIGSMATCVALAEKRPLFGQGVARGPSAPGLITPVFGLNFQLPPEPQDSRRTALAALFTTLHRVAPPQSSVAIRRDPLSTMALTVSLPRLSGPCRKRH